MLPLRRDAADLGLDGVREHAKRVRQEELRNLSLVVGQVVVERSLELHVRVLQLDEDQRQSVDVQYYVGTAKTALPFDPQLGDGEIAVLTRIVEVNQPHPFRLLLSLGIIELHRDAVAQQVVNLLIGGDESHGFAPIKQGFQCVLNRLFRDGWIQPDGGLADAIHEDDIALVATT